MATDSNHNKTIVLDGLYMYDYNGHGTIKLSGEYILKFFIYRLIDTWIPYMECHQCGRSSYCKYTKPHKYNPNKLKEIKCGVASTTLKSFLYGTYELFNSYTIKDKQSYLNSLFHLNKYILESEQLVGIFLDEEFADYYGEYLPAVIGRFSSIGEHLINFSNDIKKVKEFRSKKKMILVEGWSEKVFIDELLQSGLFRQISVEVYDGRGNGAYKKIHLLVDRLKRSGYEVSMQGDQDGSERDIFYTHKEKSLFTENEVFLFKYDFESAITPLLMYNALVELDLLTEMNHSEFLSLIYPLKQSINTTLKTKCQIDISNFKLDIASIVGQELAYLNWLGDNEFLSSEIGQFVTFLRSSYN